MEDSMNTQAAPRSWSYEEFAQLPDDENRYEVIAGELFVTPSPLTSHQVIVTRLTLLLAGFVAQHDLGTVIVGPVDLLFGPHDYLAPDLVFVARDRTGIVEPRGILGPPDLVVEVVSPSTAERDRGMKRDRYAAFGVSHYWVVDADRKHVEVHRTSGGSDEPERVTDTLHWQPAAGGPVLDISIPDLLGNLPA
jgi:Uma2 family endonuclease